MPQIDWGLTGTKQVMESEFSPKRQGESVKLHSSRETGKGEGGVRTEDKRGKISNYIMDGMFPKGQLRPRHGLVINLPEKAARGHQMGWRESLSPLPRVPISEGRQWLPWPHSGPPGEDRGTGQRGRHPGQVRHRPT